MAQDDTLEGLDAFLEDSAKEFDAPGLAVVAIKEKEVIYSRGFGYRDVDKKLEMTTSTIHPIASCTKSFTSTAIAMLVNEGKLEWDTPIREFIPQFKMKDPAVTNQITIVDMLSHRTGLPRHDFVWINDEFTYDQVLERLPHLDSSKDIRTMGYIQCDYVVNDVATGAGCINASIDDMGKWLKFHLNGGKVGNKQLVSADNLRKTHDSVIICSMTSGLDFWLPNQKWLRMDTYGLGWGGLMYRGQRVVTHGGGIDGSSSLMGFLPDEDIGVMAIVNKSDCNLPGAAFYNLFDRFLGLDPVEWNEIYRKIDAEIIKSVQGSGEASLGLRIADTEPTRPIEEYVGRYHHPGYGNFEFYIQDNELQSKTGSVEYPLTHFHYDTFQYDIKRFDVKGLLTFHADDRGEIVGFAAKIEALTPPITFSRLPDQYMRDAEFLKSLIGKYETIGIVLEIALRGDNTITCSFPGQQPSELKPVRGMRFKTKDESYSIEFKKNESGKISEFLFITSMQVFPARRIE
jgi:CubicO group peptidase (beta-lactamase class C family)